MCSRARTLCLKTVVSSKNVGQMLPLGKETMEAWHHLWHSLGATKSLIQCLIILNATEICHARRYRSHRCMVRKLPEITKHFSSKGAKLLFQVIKAIINEAQSGKRITSSPSDKCDSVTLSKLKRFSATPIRNRGREHSFGLSRVTDMIPFKKGRERIHCTALHCHKY